MPPFLNLCADQAQCQVEVIQGARREPVPQMSEQMGQAGDFGAAAPVPPPAARIWRQPPVDLFAPVWPPAAGHIIVLAVRPIATRGRLVPRADKVKLPVEKPRMGRWLGHCAADGAPVRVKVDELPFCAGPWQVPCR